MLSAITPLILSFDGAGADATTTASGRWENSFSGGHSRRVYQNFWHYRPQKRLITFDVRHFHAGPGSANLFALLFANLEFAQVAGAFNEIKFAVLFSVSC